MRHPVTDQITAAVRNDRKRALGVLLEHRPLERIALVADEHGNGQDIPPMLPTNPNLARNRDQLCAKTAAGPGDPVHRRPLQHQRQSGISALAARLCQFGADDLWRAGDHEIPLLTQPTLFIMGADDHNAPGKPNAPEALRPKMGQNAELARALAAQHARCPRRSDSGHRPSGVSRSAGQIQRTDAGLFGEVILRVEACPPKQRGRGNAPPARKLQ